MTTTGTRWGIHDNLASAEISDDQFHFFFDDIEPTTTVSYPTRSYNGWYGVVEDKVLPWRKQHVQHWQPVLDGERRVRRVSLHWVVAQLLPFQDPSAQQTAPFAWIIPVGATRCRPGQDCTDCGARIAATSVAAAASTSGAAASRQCSSSMFEDVEHDDQSIVTLFPPDTEVEGAPSRTSARSTLATTGTATSATVAWPAGWTRRRARQTRPIHQSLQSPPPPPPFVCMNECDDIEATGDVVETTRASRRARCPCWWTRTAVRTFSTACTGGQTTATSTRTLTARRDKMACSAALKSRSIRNEYRRRLWNCREDVRYAGNTLYNGDEQTSKNMLASIVTFSVDECIDYCETFTGNARLTAPATQ